MVNTQEWLDEEYPKAIRGSLTKLVIKDKNLTGSLNLSDFPNLEKLDCSKNQLSSLDVSNCIKLKKLVCYSNKLTGLVLDNCPQLEKIDCRFNVFTTLKVSNQPSLRELVCYYNCLTTLIVTDNPQLTELDCFACKLTTLSLDNNPRLAKIWCQNNQLSNLNFLNVLDPKSLVVLDISDNNFRNNLSLFSRFINLEELHVGGNFFTGSLSPLQFCQKLEWLTMGNTQINDGLEYLPKSVKKIRCAGQLARELKDYEKDGYYNYQLWMKDHKELIEKVQPEKETLFLLEQLPSTGKEENDKNWETSTNFTTYSDDRTLVGELVEEMGKKWIASQQVIEEYEELQLKFINEEEELKKLRELLANFTNSQEDISKQIKTKRSELETLKNDCLKRKSNYSQEELTNELEELLEAQRENNIKLRERIKKSLLKETSLTVAELENLCQAQEKLFSLDSELGVVTWNIRETKEKIIIINNYTYNYGLSEEKFNELMERLTGIEQTIEKLNQAIEERSEKQIAGLSVNQALTEKEKEIIKKAINLLDSKKIFLNLRQGTIQTLQAYCDKFEQAHTTGKYAIIDDVSDIITNAGEITDPLIAVSISVSPVAATGGIIKGVNSLFKKKSITNNSKKIQEVLVTDKKSILLFDEYYTSLINAIWNNEEDKVSKIIIEIFDLKKNKLSLFVEHDVFQILNIWKGKSIIILDEMKDSIEKLNSDLKGFKAKLENEENQFQQRIFTKFKEPNNQQYQTQIEQLSTPTKII